MIRFQSLKKLTLIVFANLIIALQERKILGALYSGILSSKYLLKIYLSVVFPTFAKAQISGFSTYSFTQVCKASYSFLR